jgi:4-amino-4-deoxy-L-arabinose transferase-like glycosyltransferase
MQTLNKKIILGLFACASVAYILGLFIRLMEIDACEYALISREMFETGSYLVVKLWHAHYLDKPPLLFWLSSLSFRAFGISDLAYRLPSLLFTILGIFSTFRLGRLLYNQKIGTYAALILATCQAYFLFNHDVRADTILAGATIFSIWQLAEYLKTNKATNFILAFLGISAAMLTKGPIGIMVPILAFGTHFVFKKDWKNLFKWQWLVGIGIVLIILIPMLWGLYQHASEYPNNPLYQKDKFYGLKFYFWIQSFGRITGQSVWRNNHDPFFFVHSFLWSFLPWSIFAFAGISKGLYRFFIRKNHSGAALELITLGGVVLPFIAFSFSKYVLPHYIFVFYPLAAIIAAKTIEEIIKDSPRVFKTFFWIQAFIIFLIWVLSFSILAFFFPTGNFLLWFIFAAIVILSVITSLQVNSNEIKIIVPSAVAIIGLNIILNAYFYPKLLEYQSDTKAALIANASKIDKSRIVTFGTAPRSFDYVTGSIPSKTTDIKKIYSLMKQGKSCIFTTDKGISIIRKLGIKPKKIYVLDSYKVTNLTLKFLNSKTRDKAINKSYLLMY